MWHIYIRGRWTPLKWFLSEEPLPSDADIYVAAVTWWYASGDPGNRIERTASLERSNVAQYRTSWKNGPIGGMPPTNIELRWRPQHDL